MSRIMYSTVYFLNVLRASFVYRTLTSVNGDSKECSSISCFWLPSHFFSSGKNLLRKSTGSGKIMVEFFSAEMDVSVCRYRS